MIETDPMTVKVMHWNVWHRADPSEIVDRIAEIDPDIACLVELAEDSSYFPGINVADKVYDELGFIDGIYEPVHHLRAKRGKSWVKDGAGIFSKFPLKETEVHTLSQRGWDAKYRGQDYRRIYLGASAILSDSSTLRVGSVHLSLPQASIGHRGVRTEEANKLAQILSDREKLVLVGDFNAGPNALSVRQASNQLVRIDKNLEGPTFSRKINILGRAVLIKKRLDYVFCSADLQVKNAQTLPAEPSDHSPLVVEIELL